ncbi:histone H2A-beta, sperm-like [Gracilinanus agilis]|uniref:histone H2A-beta, sperm-like n=1 Tax=Gracilinanus agilis TaxID=191870 RepID=UPI001CFC908A|nr:histone H2A-beta, sperm-like [Gracilinanus agilis]
MSEPGKVNIKKTPSFRRFQADKTGLKFPTYQIYRYLKTGYYAKRISTEAPIYLAAVMEYLTTELLELSGNVAQRSKKAQINPLHIQQALEEDDELRDFLNTAMIPNGAAVLPYIHPNLFSWKS